MSDNSGFRILIVVADFYEHIAQMQLDAAKTAIYSYGSAISHIDFINVAGALEIPSIISFACRDNLYDGYVALGCVIRGETTHYDIVANESCRALMDLSITKNIAIGNGILTVENEQQALERADKTQLDKAGGAVHACLSVLKNFELLQLKVS